MMHAVMTNPIPSTIYPWPASFSLRVEGSARILPCCGCLNENPHARPQGYELTGSPATITQLGLCFRFKALEIPVTVPPVPAPATKTLTLPEEGREGVDGVDTTASIISGPVVYS